VKFFYEKSIFYFTSGFFVVYSIMFLAQTKISAGQGGTNETSRFRLQCFLRDQVKGSLRMKMVIFWNQMHTPLKVSSVVAAYEKCSTRRQLSCHGDEPFYPAFSP
jgi:hypothetical protein